MKKILLTGFEPFDQHKINSSGELVKILSAELSLDYLILPVSYSRAYGSLEKHLEKNNYDFILMLGLASDRHEVNLERVGLNMMDSKIPDADGAHPRGEKISEKGEGALFCELPIMDWIKDTEMKISNHAGAYVCNYLYYRMLMGEYAQKSLFVHVPPIKDSTHQSDLLRDLRNLVQRCGRD